MEVTWFGHANFKIKTGDTTIFIDPFFVGNPSSPTTYQEIDACDLILVTHDHTDHVGQTLELAIKHDAEVVAIFDTIQFMGSEVATYCIGQAASGAAIILMAGTKGKRYILEVCRSLYG